MVEEEKRKKKRAKGEKDVKEKRPGMFSAMQPNTLRGIGGVSLFVVAILLMLSALGMAGLVGVQVYEGLYFLFGVGYVLLPFMCIGWALALFTKDYEENKLRSIRTVGALTFFVSTLAAVSVVGPEHAGLLGRSIATPMLAYLDTVATLVVLAGLIVVSMLLLFDSELWVTFFKKVRDLFKRPTSSPETEVAHTFAEDTRNDEEEDAEDQTVPECAPQKRESEIPTPPKIEESAENGTEFDTLFVEKDAKKERAPAFQVPSEYVAPPLSLLESDRGKPNVGDTKARANLIRRTLLHFKIPVEMDEIVVGPTVTRYSLKPAEGVKLSKIVALQSNLELALAASPIRIEAPIPGKSLVGIEVPNTGKAIVGLAGLLSSPEFTEESVPLFVTLGKDIAGTAHYANIGKMPHLLVAGTTGSGKSVMIHTLITSLIFRNAPERVRFIMVDPKRVELTLYNNIPHLLTPVITEAKKCILSLKWAAKEMDRRYDVLQGNRVQDISGYHNEVVAPALEELEKLNKAGKDTTDFEMPETMPHIVIVIDELADIMSAYPRELEAAIVRLAQMSRAVGIHLILSTQRPSVNVITGLIKANIPTRIALKVASLIDSRTILDQPGAEKLLGAGDMLYLSGDMAKPRRIQSPFLTTAEVKKIANFLTKHNNYMLGVGIDLGGEGGENQNGGLSFDDTESEEGLDELYEDVREYVIKDRKASTSLIQRRFKVGYGRAARIMDQLEERGVIGHSDGTNRPREVLEGGQDMAQDAARSEHL